MGELEAQFQAAKRAFVVVSKQPTSAASAELTKATDIKTALGKLSASDIWLTPHEYEAIQNKKFDAFDIRNLSEDAQIMRNKIVIAVQLANEYGRDGKVTQGVLFRAHYDPDLLVEVEQALQADTTAKMLLEHAKERHLPIVFAEYEIDETTFKSAAFKLALGALASPEYQKGQTFHLITAFKNAVKTASEHAITIAHELRHFRFKSLFNIAEHDALEPQDQIIASLLDEADAQSVYRKVAWSFRNKKIPVGTYASAAHDFDKYYTRPLYSGLPVSRRVQRATQDCFIAFIYKELTQPVYIKSYVYGYVERGLKLGTATRKIDQSTLLEKAFLTRLSQVTENVSYLDAEGMKAVREMITQKLPEVLERLEKAALEAKAKGQKPEP
ncbi:MAG: DUF6782 family putative metallopeptidase [Alphaproteobacteria bacterium]|nr:DUF6782 family putative metallopeptidase [Alphaproteobacteria bacterium]